jgi:hypothetical protein
MEVTMNYCYPQLADDDPFDMDFGRSARYALNRMALWEDRYGFDGRSRVGDVPVENKRVRKSSKPTQVSPGTGISWDKRNGVWLAQITYFVNKKRFTIRIGSFEDTPEGIEKSVIALHRVLDELIRNGKKPESSRIKYAPLNSLTMS